MSNDQITERLDVPNYVRQFLFRHEEHHLINPIYGRQTCTHCWIIQELGRVQQITESSKVRGERENN